MAINVGEIEATLKLKDELSAELKKSEKALEGFESSIADTDKLLDEVQDQFAATGASAEDMGSEVRNAANEVANAIKAMGGAAKVPAAGLAQLTGLVDAAIKEYQKLGQTAPAALRELSNETNKLTQDYAKWSAAARQVATEQNRLFVDIQKVNDLTRQFGGSDVIRKAEEYAAAVQKIGGVSKLTQQEQKNLNAVMSEAIEKTNALGISGHTSAAQFATLKDATQGAVEPMRTFGQSVSAAWNTIKGFAGALGIGLGVGALVGLAKKAFDTAEQIGNMSEKLQVSTTKVQQWSHGLRQSGSDINGLEGALEFMNKTIGAGSDSTIALLTRMGLSIENLRRMSQEDVFEALVKSVGQIKNGFEQADATVKLFGRTGQDLLPAIRNNFIEVGKGATIMSEETVKRLKDAKQAWENFFNSVVIHSGEILADIARVIKGFKDLADVPFFGGSRTPLKPGERAGSLLKQDHLIDRFGSALGAAEPLSDAFTGPIQDLSNLSVQLDIAQKALKALSQAKKEDIQAGIALTLSTEKISESTGVAANVIELYKDQLQKSSSAAKSAASEAQKVADALKNLQSSLASLTDAQIAQIQTALIAGASEADIAKAYGFTAKQVGALAEQLKESEQVEKDVAKQREKQAEALEELASGMHTLTAEQVKQIATLLEAGKAQADIAAAYGFTKQEVKAVDQELNLHAKTLGLISKIEEKYWKDQIKFASETAKQTAENLKKITSAERDLADLRDSVGATSVANSIRQIQRWAAEQKAAFKGTAEEAKRFGAIIDQIANIKIDQLGPSIQKVKQALMETANSFPDMLAQAIINSDSAKDIGEHLKKAISASLAGLGGKLGEQLGQSLAKVGSFASQMLGQVFGALGSIAGAALGKLFDINKNVTKETREKFAESMGFDNLGKLYDDLRKLGTQGQQLANIGLNVIGRKDEAANKQWMKDVEKFYDKIKADTESIKKVISETGHLWGQEMRSFIQNTPGFGEAIKTQLSGATKGLTTFLTAGATATKAIQDITKEMDGLSETDEKWKDLNKELIRNKDIIEAIGVTSQESAEAMGASIAGIFGELLRQGVNITDAVEQIAPAVSALQTQLNAAGLSGGAAFDAIKGFVDLVGDSVAGPVLQAVSGLDDALVGLQNTGLMNQATFEALTGQISQAFTALVNQGKDGDQVMRLMQPTLQTIWELQKDFGFAVDETTQMLLEQAEAAGIVGEKSRDPMERLILAMDSVVEILKEIAKGFGFLPDEAAAAARGVEGAFKDVQIDVPVRFRMGDLQLPEGPEVPGFAGGTGGQYPDFGKGTLAVLHGREKITPLGEEEGMGGGMLTVVIEADGRVLSQTIAPYLPYDVKRYKLA